MSHHHHHIICHHCRYHNSVNIITSVIIIAPVVLSWSYNHYHQHHHGHHHCHHHHIPALEHAVVAAYPQMMMMMMRELTIWQTDIMWVLMIETTLMIIMIWWFWLICWFWWIYRLWWICQFWWISRLWCYISITITISWIQCNICSVRQRRRVRKNRIMHITPSGHPDHYSHAIWRHRHHHHHRQRHPHHHLYCNCHCHRHRQCHRHHHCQHHRHHHHHCHQHCHFHCNWLFMTQEWRPEGRLQWIQEITAKILGSPQLVLEQALIICLLQAHLGSTDLQDPCWSPISISLSAIIFGSCLCSTMHDAEYQPKVHKTNFMHHTEINPPRNCRLFDLKGPLPPFPVHFYVNIFLVYQENLSPVYMAVIWGVNMQKSEWFLNVKFRCKFASTSQL